MSKATDVPDAAQCVEDRIGLLTSAPVVVAQLKSQTPHGQVPLLYGKTVPISATGAVSMIRPSLGRPEN